MDLFTVIWIGNDDNRSADAASGDLVAKVRGRYMREVKDHQLK